MCHFIFFIFFSTALTSAALVRSYLAEIFFLPLSFVAFLSHEQHIFHKKKPHANIKGVRTCVAPDTSLLPWPAACVVAAVLRCFGSLPVLLQQPAAGGSRRFFPLNLPRPAMRRSPLRRGHTLRLFVDGNSGLFFFPSCSNQKR